MALMVALIDAPRYRWRTTIVGGGMTGWGVMLLQSGVVLGVGPVAGGVLLVLWAWLHKTRFDGRSRHLPGVRLSCKAGDAEIRRILMARRQRARELARCR